jgi:hypothetical protein
MPMPAPGQQPGQPAQPAAAAPGQPIRQALNEIDVIDGTDGTYRLVSAAIQLTSFGNPSTITAPGVAAPAPVPVNPAQPQAPSCLGFQATVGHAGLAVSEYSLMPAGQSGVRDAFGTGYLTIAIPEAISRADGTLVTKALTFQMGPAGPVNQWITPLHHIETLADYDLRGLGSFGLGQFDPRGPKYQFFSGVRSGIDVVAVTTKNLGYWPMTVTATFHYEMDAGNPNARAAHR